MTLPMGFKGQPDFTQPIELLADCHRRIEKFLAVLRRVVERSLDGELDGESRAALETALRYFRQAAPRHTADEEVSLFPRLRSIDHPRAKEAMALIAELESDHRVADSAHARVDAICSVWLADGILYEATRGELKATLAELAEHYERHIKLEEESVFSVAAQVLDADRLREIGREMQRRRHDDPGRPGSKCAERRVRSQVGNA